MSLISRYMLREIAWPCLLAFVVVGFVGAGNELRERAGDLNVDFLTAFDLLRLAIYFIPTIFSYVLPVTFMMGILLAFGGFADRNEITAMRAAGIPLKRLIVTPLAAGLFLALVSLVLQAYVQPWAVRRTNELIFSELLVRGTLDVLPPGKMHTFGGGSGTSFSVYFARKNEETLTLEDIDILIARPGGDVNMFHAESAQLVVQEGAPLVHLRNGYFLTPREDGYFPARFDERTIEGPAVAAGAIPSPRAARSLAGLFADERELTASYESTKNPRFRSGLSGVRREIASRLSLPWACFAVALVAAPMAARQRAGGRSHGFFVGLAIGLSFYLMLELFDPSSLKSLGEVILRWFAPVIALAVAGSILIWRVDRV